jgi:hypothetical protein
VKPRILYTVRVSVQGILDLTVAANLDQAGLTLDHLSTGAYDYDRCQEVGAAAHQLGYHGILAPAAHGLGQTLALFRERITPRELPIVESEVVWNGLPPDPRLPRAVHIQRGKGA